MRAVDQVQQGVVLPQAEAEREGERDPADDQPRAQLVEVLDEAQALLVVNRADRSGHLPF